MTQQEAQYLYQGRALVADNLMMPALDGDTLGDAGQRVQDAANGLHLQVHVEGTPAQLI